MRAAAAGGLSVAVAESLRLPFPLYAMISAIIVTDLSAAQTRRLGAPRLAGTALGATIGAALGPVAPSGLIAITVGVFLAMYACYLVRVPTAARLSGYVCGITLLHYSDQPWSYAAYRFIETVLGLVAALAVSLLPRLIREDGEGVATQRADL